MGSSGVENELPAPTAWCAAGNIPVSALKPNGQWLPMSSRNSWPSLRSTEDAEPGPGAEDGGPGWRVLLSDPDAVSRLLVVGEVDRWQKLRERTLDPVTPPTHTVCTGTLPAAIRCTT